MNYFCFGLNRSIVREVHHRPGRTPPKVALNTSAESGDVPYLRIIVTVQPQQVFEDKGIRALDKGSNGRVGLLHAFFVHRRECDFNPTKPITLCISPIWQG